MDKIIKESAMIFVYNEIYDTYKKILRTRKDDGLKSLRISLYKERLRQLQEIIKGMRIKCTFKEVIILAVICSLILGGRIF